MLQVAETGVAGGSEVFVSVVVVKYTSEGRLHFFYGQGETQAGGLSVCLPGDIMPDMLNGSPAAPLDTARAILLDIGLEFSKGEFVVVGSPRKEGSHQAYLYVVLDERRDPESVPAIPAGSGVSWKWGDIGNFKAGLSGWDRLHLREALIKLTSRIGKDQIPKSWRPKPRLLVEGALEQLHNS